MAVQAVPVPASGGHKKFWAIVIGSLIALFVAVAAIGGSSTATPTATKAPATAAVPKAAPAVKPAPAVAPPAAPSQASQVSAWTAVVLPDLTAFGDASTAVGNYDGTLADMRSKMAVALATGRALQATLRTHPAPTGVALGAGNIQKAVDMAVVGISQSIQGIDNADPAMMTRGTETVTAAGALMSSATSDLTAEMAAL